MMEETVILNFEVDQTEAQKSLVQTEKNIRALKEEQKELNKEYKAGKISEDQYIESNLKLQRAIKNESDQKRQLTKLIDTESNSRNAIKARISQLVAEYDNLNTKTAAGAKRSAELQKELKDLNAQITSTSKSAGLFKDQIGNYPDQFKSAIDQVKPFGLSIEGIGSSFAKFLNPATAAVGVLTGLAAAYAKSATGARDLEFAQSTLAAATQITANAIGNLISTGEEQEGLISRLVSGILFNLSPALAIAANQAANAELAIKNLEISRALAAGNAKEDERTAENLRRIRDDENKSLEERLATIEGIDQVLSRSAQRSVIVIQAQIAAIKAATQEYEKNRQAQLQVAQLEAEISDKQEEINGKLTENVTARRTILKLIEEARKAESEAIKAESADDRAQRRAIDTLPGESDTLRGEATKDRKLDQLVESGKLQVDAQTAINDSLLKANSEFYERDLARQKYVSEQKQRIQEAELAATTSILGAAASLFDQQSSEYKIFATAQALISTYAAATKAYEAAFIPPTIASPVIGAAYAAAAIAQGLANVAAINNVQFAEGGYTGPGTKYQPAGIVHAGEVVWSQADVSAAGGPMAANAMRPTVRGYADGGFVANQSTAATQQAMITANALKNMPPIYVSWREGQSVGTRVQWRENISSR